MAIIQTAQMGILTSQARTDLYDKTVDKFVDITSSTPTINLQFASEQPASNLTYVIQDVNDVMATPPIRQDTDTNYYDEPPPGQQATITIYPYRTAFRITKTIELVDKSGLVRKAGLKGLPEAGKRLIEVGISTLLNTVTSATGSDSVALAATTHPYDDPSYGTWSNLETSAALTSTTVGVMRQNFEKRKNERGYVTGRMMVTVMGSPDLHRQLMEITTSDLTPELSTHAANWKGLTYIINPYLTSTTGYFGIGDGDETQRGLIYAVLTPPTVGSLGYPNADYPEIVYGASLVARVGFGATKLRNMHYNVGT